MKRTRTSALGVTKSATRNSLKNQPPLTSLPAGPTVSTGVQAPPTLLEISTRKVSALGAAPPVFEYQRQ
jgi:hypothetical protein